MIILHNFCLRIFNVHALYISEDADFEIRPMLVQDMGCIRFMHH